MVDLSNKTVIISRTDSIGDVMLTLPICSWLKGKFSNLKIVFLGKGYTRSVVEAYDLVDEFLDLNDLENQPKPQQVEMLKGVNAEAIIHVFPTKELASLAKKAKIKERVGTSHRTFHLMTCNHRVNFTRKRSDFHESQLNHELLRPFGLTELPSLEEIVKTTGNFHPKETILPDEFEALKDFTILHPKSQGSAKEWPLENYMKLASKLASEGRRVVFTGTQSEGAQFKGLIPSNENIIDSTGKLTLEQLMILISRSHNLVACSTGPLHIAGYLGVNTTGLFSPKRPIHPGRWKALGPNVHIIVKEENCEKCSKGQDCDCIEKIDVEQVYDKLK